MNICVVGGHWVDLCCIATSPTYDFCYSTLNIVITFHFKKGFTGQASYMEVRLIVSIKFPNNDSTNINVDMLYCY